LSPFSAALTTDGLGLPIAPELARAWGGEASIANRNGRSGDHNSGGDD
jgi:hypothetical protein